MRRRTVQVTSAAVMMTGFMNKQAHWHLTWILTISHDRHGMAHGRRGEAFDSYMTCADALAPDGARNRPRGRSGGVYIYIFDYFCCVYYLRRRISSWWYPCINKSPGSSVWLNVSG